MKFLRLLFLLGAILAAPPTVEARTLGLLIGVADYNDASGIRDLLGPRNDVTILWRALKARGAEPADLMVLADNLPQGPAFPVAKALPESGNILAELDRLAERAAPGDTVFIYYSGHGTVQPDNPDEPEDEPETDGMDQVLLPADVGAYSPITRSLKNAIVDDELGRKISAIRAKGAFVWAVVDACHSGTVTRGETVTRTVDPVLLGIPAGPVQTSRNSSRQGTMKLKTHTGEGGIVGFYAVESYDEAIERAFPGYDLPMAGEADTQRLGVFTYLLHRALTRNTASTYRELAQEIVSEMNLDHTGGKVPPPVFDGDLDAPLPGSDAARLPSSSRGIVESGRITFPVGSLQGFEAGARLALYAPGHTEIPIGMADVISATAISSIAENIAWADGADPVTEGTVAAVVSNPAISFSFVVSPPPPQDLTPTDRDIVSMALDGAFGTGAEAIGISMGAPGNPDADVLLRVRNGRLWVVRADRPWVETAGAPGETPSLALDAEPEKLAADLKTAIWSLARAAKLLRVAAALGESAGADDGIVIKATVSRLAGQEAHAVCKGSEPPPGAQAMPLDPLLPAAAVNCDFVSIDVSNQNDADYYIAGFYVDALGGVYAVPGSTARKGCVRVLTAGADRPLNFRFWIDTWDEKAQRPSAIGAENFVILAIAKDRTNQPPRLCALTQPTLSAMQQSKGDDTRNATPKLAALLNGVGGETTRAMGSADDGGAAMTGRLFVFDVRP
ncbi:MAG: caspase family protein [Alphaproteobacteria bacterium]|nr:caspase family protein [Alphaproteobacteria bacterium]